MIVCIVLFLLGLGILLYPAASNQWNKWRQEQLVSDYTSSLTELETQGEDFSAEWARAYAYNETLHTATLSDSFTITGAQEEPDEEYMACLNLAGDGIMGYVSIPSLDLKLPIYHTTSDEVLQEGVGHLEGSSLPVGGESTHAVLAGHRGLPNQELFANLDLLEEGDVFLIYVLDSTLCYEVDQILVVEPTDTEALSVVEGQDLVTLLTCTPYGVNTERLLVRGHRVEYEEETVEEETQTVSVVTTHTHYLLWALGGLTVTALLTALLYLFLKKSGGRDKKRERKESREE